MKDLNEWFQMPQILGDIKFKVMLPKKNNNSKWESKILYMQKLFKQVEWIYYYRIEIFSFKLLSIEFGLKDLSEDLRKWF